MFYQALWETPSHFGISLGRQKPGGKDLKLITAFTTERSREEIGLGSTRRPRPAANLVPLEASCTSTAPRRAICRARLATLRARTGRVGWRARGAGPHQRMDLAR